MRDILSIPCEGVHLLATLDGPADATVGWLFVVGGTQTRVGPHRLYERLAARLADAGHAVIRFDRRGVGDSGGTDPGYAESAADILAAAHALRAQRPKLKDMIGFGLCDGATALALHGRAARFDRLVLANPWIVEPKDDLPPPAAIRGHYRARLLDPRAWARLLSGRVNPAKLIRGLIRSGRKEDDGLSRRFAAGLATSPRVILAEGDGTAQTFAAAWQQLGPGTPPIETIRIATASHSFADPAAFEALARALEGAVTPPR